MKNGSVDSLKLRERCGWQSKGLKQPMHRRFGNPAGLGRQAHRPVCPGGRFARQRTLEQSGDLLIGDRARPSRAQFVIEAGQSMPHESFTPLADGDVGPAQSLRNTSVAFACGRPQHQLGASHQGMRKSAGAGKATQSNPFVLGQSEYRFGAAGDHAAQLYRKLPTYARYLWDTTLALSTWI